ncbi:unnamed protein product [Adineta steineri]|uniref:Uncharacterized protein n=1 Tax=Adineta steineri TaxID=433720 RepID=A0A815J0Z0_9BILA|nr:unnamed protein product [Adineta steineri]CAF3552433.1 unnamed protein product [Adineta steineri]
MLLGLFTCNRGNCYFYGQNTGNSAMWQYVNMTSTINAVLIDSHTVYYNFSAWLGGWQGDRDSAQASLTFYNQTNQTMGSTVALGPVTHTDRADITSLLYREADGIVPVGW